MYWAGLGVATDKNKSIELYKKAAENGNVSSQNTLAGLYMAGNGIKKDFVKALAWTVISAKNGHAKSQSIWLLVQRKATTAQTKQALQMAHTLFPKGGYLSKDIINFTTPPGWKLAFKDPKGTIVEYVPEKETVKNWTDMLTIFTHPGPVNVRRMAINTINIWKKSCGKLRHQIDPKLKSRAKLKETYVILICDDPAPKKGLSKAQVLDKEIVWIKFIRGALKTFQIQRAYHHKKGIAEKKVLKERFNKRLLEWSKFFKTAKVSSQ